MNQLPQNQYRLVAFATGCSIAVVLVLLVVGALSLANPSRGSVADEEPATRISDAAATVTPLIALGPTSAPPLVVTLPASTVGSIPTITPLVITPSSPLPVQATPIRIPQNSVRRLGNGPDALARYMPKGQVVLDGLVEEWGAESIPLTIAHFGAEEWSGPQDLSGAGWLGWNEERLFLAVNVIDDRYVQTQKSWEMFRGDSVEFWLDSDLAGDFDIAQGNFDDWQFGFSPGNFSTLPSEGVLYLPVRNATLHQQIFVAAQPNANGYTLEASIPWGLLSVQPQPGMVLGYAIDLSDNDDPLSAQQQTQVNHNPNFRFNVPTTFGNLVLE